MNNKFEHIVTINASSLSQIIWIFAWRIFNITWRQFLRNSYRKTFFFHCSTFRVGNCRLRLSRFNRIQFKVYKHEVGGGSTGGSRQGFESGRLWVREKKKKVYRDVKKPLSHWIIFVESALANEINSNGAAQSWCWTTSKSQSRCRVGTALHCTDVDPSSRVDLT
jgi:hypothetical protein